LELQLEVPVLLLAAQEGVEFEPARVGGADQGAVLDRPVLGQPLPALQVLAVEELGLAAAVGAAGGPQDEAAGQGENHGGVAHRGPPKEVSAARRRRTAPPRHGPPAGPLRVPVPAATRRRRAGPRPAAAGAPAARGRGAGGTPIPPRGAVR